MIDDIKETVGQFRDKIAFAQGNGDEYIETSDEIIKFYNKRGLGTAKYFIFEGIKVFPHGQAEAILAEEDVPVSKRIHGPKEGDLVVGNDPTDAA